MPTSQKATVVFVHGLWIHSSSWKDWRDFFESKGYKTLAPGWPGDSNTVEGCRNNPGPLANRGVTEIADSYEKEIRKLSQPPILIGHSFGGLLVQILLGRGLAVAAVAIDPAPIKGVWQLPLTVIRASLPVLSNPFNFKKEKPLTFSQFNYGFSNALPEKEARELYDKWTISGPCKPLFQAGLATFAGIETKVNTENTTRGPLLITGGEKDNIAPPVLGRVSAAKYNKKVVTDFKLFTGRGHSLVVDHGWQEVAQYSLDWLNKNGL